MSIRFISLGTRPFLHITFICDTIGMPEEKWMQLALYQNRHSLAMVKTPDGMYFEESGATLAIERSCTNEVFHKWKRHVKRNNCKRKLTASEKKSIAAEANFTCELCHLPVKDYEIDHIEQHALRGNDERYNLQCLCPNCHREKTRKDRHFGDAMFEKRVQIQTTHLHGGGGNIFSSYFHHQ